MDTYSCCKSNTFIFVPIEQSYRTVLDKLHMGFDIAWLTARGNDPYGRYPKSIKWLKLGAYIREWIMSGGTVSCGVDLWRSGEGVDFERKDVGQLRLWSPSMLMAVVAVAPPSQSPLTPALEIAIWLSWVRSSSAVTYACSTTSHQAPPPSSAGSGRHRHFCLSNLRPGELFYCSVD